VPARCTLDGMKPVAFSMHFRGFSSALSPGVVTAKATAPSGALVTRIDGTGPHAGFERVEGGEAHMECRLTFSDDIHFDEVGTISFGNGNALRFRSIAPGTLEPSVVPALRQGSVTWALDGGAGIFAGASGRLVSNFLVADSGEITDHQVAVVFLER
jgi:hypothetical protein